VELLPSEDSVAFYGTGAMIALGFLIAGLIASVFHLGRPERAWRAAAQWRTSWLSREVIALPVLMFLVFLYGIMHYFGWDTVLFTSKTGARLQVTLVVGTLGAIATFALFLCTGMIYAAVKFLQEWASPLTVINYLLLGTMSGFTLATAFASLTAPESSTSPASRRPSAFVTARSSRNPWASWAARSTPATSSTTRARSSSRS